MKQSRAGERPLADVIDRDLPAEELERLARVDAVLRAAAAYDLGAAHTVHGCKPPPPPPAVD
jgi:hypothetical protein